MMRGSLKLVVLLITLGVGIGLKELWVIVADPAEVPPPGVRSLSPVIITDQPVSAGLNIWCMHEDDQAGQVPMHITPIHGACELIGNPDYLIPDELVRRCSELKAMGKPLDMAHGWGNQW